MIVAAAQGNQNKSIKKVDVDKLSEAELRALVPGLLDQMKLLTQQVEQLNRMVFGRRSEKSRYLNDKSGILPFDDVDQLAAEREEAEAVAETVEIPAHRRKVNKRRKDFPDHLPRRHTTFVVDRDELPCPDCGNERYEIGSETTKELERIEFTFVHELERKKYACRECEGNVVTAVGGQRVLPKCMLGPGFLAQIIFERFGNHMPYARLEKKYKAEGLSLARSVMCSSVMRCAELLKPVYEAHKRDVLESLETSVLQGDDTTITQRNGRNSGQRKVYLWAWRDQHAGVFYTITEQRNRAGPRDLLGDRRGRLQCDGHDCFSDLDEILRIGCWAHARRYFEKAQKSGDEHVHRMMEWIGKLFAIEKEAKSAKQEIGRDLTDDELVDLRQKKSKPITTAIKAWLDDTQARPPSLPAGPLMVGVNYTLNQWQTLIRFLDDGRIREISNNGCERALRAPVIGRKNWYFFGSEEGAAAGVIMMSLVQSCREHEINPLLYLRDVLHLISSTPQSRIAELTPRGWKAVGVEIDRRKRAKDAIADVVANLRF